MKHFGETEAELLRALVKEKRDLPEFQVEFALRDSAETMYLIANLQLALRHPGNDGGAARFAQALVERLTNVFREAGYAAHVRVIEKGNEPPAPAGRVFQ